MVGFAAFNGVTNVLMLSGSLYMLQVYDRLIPSRNLATLLRLSADRSVRLSRPGYFDALRSRMLCRMATHVR
jgi:ATP-binding cassette subfamily C protein PrsD